MSRIEVTKNRIEGFADVYGTGREISVISFNKLFDVWNVGSSMCLPSSITQAMRVMEAYNMAFEALTATSKGEI